MAQVREKKSGARQRSARLLSSLLLLLALVLSCIAALLFVSKGEGSALMQKTTTRELGAAAYMALLYLLFAGYMAFQQKRVFRDVKLMTIVVILLSIMPWLQLVCNMLDVHVTPMLFAVMLAAELIDHRMGIAMTVLLAAESAIFAAEGELFSTVAFVMCTANVASGMAAVFALKRTTTRSGMIAAAAAGGAAGAMAVAAIYLIRGEAVRTVLTACGCVLFSDLFAGLLVIGSLTIWEHLFDIATTARLNELLNTNNPLLKQLMYDAPGTYQHCMNVAALAEGAAEKIGANQLLARVGATYHDVGKLRRPQYFKENQQGENIHDTLAPQESASIIISHQKDGATILAKNKLPGDVIRIAAEHHGNSLMTYFYHKAGDEGEANPKNFRYPGNRPGTKEGAIVMLADCCEAAVRSLGECTAEAREAMVHRIIWSKLTDGENMLSEAPLTIADISDIERSFLRTFGGLMHDRIEYPEEKKE